MGTGIYRCNEPVRVSERVRLIDDAGVSYK